MSTPDWAPLGARVPVELVVTAYGEASEPTALVLHGLFGSGRNWSTIARRLAGRLHVLTPDLRNHGASPWAQDMSYEAMAADLVLLAAGHGPVTLVGHSMGGKTAMMLALARPDLVARLVVVDVAPVRYAPVFLAYAQAMANAHLEGVTRRSEVDPQLAAAVPDPGVRAFLLQNLVLSPDGARWRVNLPVLERSMPELSDFPDIPRGVSYGGPTTFITGGRSGYVTAEALPVIGRLFPGARRVIVPGAGHWVHTERLEDFVVALDAALAGAR